MRALALLLLLIYVGLTPAQPIAEHAKLPAKAEQLLNAVVATYPALIPNNSLVDLKRLFAIIPKQLLEITVPDEMEIFENYWLDHTNISSSADSVNRAVLHFLLHQYDDQYAISRSHQWRYFSGWKSNWFGVVSTANNQDPRAYAELRGLHSPAEDFVTIAEHFILPPISSVENSIKCRTPLKYRYVESLFQAYTSPLENNVVQCRDISTGMLDDVVFTDPNNGKQINLGPVNEETVLGYELLYATPGSGDASEIAGHLLLRIKLDNNRQAKKLGIENPKDLVISFLANTRSDNGSENTSVARIQKECSKNWLDSSKTSQGQFDALRSIVQSLKGLSGGFLTLMDRQTLAEAIKNYTIEEDRDLLRYELKFDSTQSRRLLEQLYRAKKNYNASYYFFYQNCASVLVKVIGLGIESEEIAEFSPLVSPPNSLVALFIREGLAKPIRPAFFSYRKKAYLAQELIKIHYHQMTQAYSTLNWPNISALFSSDQQDRLGLIQTVGRYVGHRPELNAQLHRFLVLVQESEMAFEHKDLVCEQYTSAVTAQARRYQRAIFASTPVALSAVATDELLARQFIDTAAESYRQGVPHTKLLAFAAGVGQYSAAGKNNAVMSLDATLDEQELGSISNVAMQRSSYVKLASTKIVLSPKAEHPDKLQAWRFTALDIRKFKDRLGRVPRYFSSAGSIGLGLSLLDFEKDYLLDIEHGSWIGGELLFNLASSAEHNDYLYVSLGADMRRHKQADQSHDGIALPARLETLWTMDNKRRWQWRNKLEYRHSLDGDIGHEADISTGLTYQIGEVGGQLLLLRVSGEYKKYRSNVTSQLSWIGIEFNPF